MSSGLYVDCNPATTQPIWTLDTNHLQGRLQLQQVQVQCSVHQKAENLSMRVPTRILITAEVAVSTLQALGMLVTLL